MRTATPCWTWRCSRGCERSRGLRRLPARAERVLIRMRGTGESDTVLTGAAKGHADVVQLLLLTRRIARFQRSCEARKTALMWASVTGRRERSPPWWVF